MHEKNDNPISGKRFKYESIPPEFIDSNRLAIMIDQIQCCIDNQNDVDSLYRSL